MNPDQASINEARELLLTRDSGVLSTISVQLPGFPFGSLVPYSTDEHQFPVVLISGIAQHTRNVLADPKCSLTIVEAQQGHVQAKGRLTIIGSMEMLGAGDDEVKEKYYRYYSEARTYHKTHDFEFYRLRPVRYRYIGGFGKIFWIDPAQMAKANPFFGAEERGMVMHMNEDHQSAMRAYLGHFRRIKVGSSDELSMAGLDQQGFDLVVNKQKVRIPFPRPVNSPEEVRTALVEMAKQARS